MAKKKTNQQEKKVQVKKKVQKRKKNTRTSNPQLSSSASFLRLNVLSSLN